MGSLGWSHRGCATIYSLIHTSCRSPSQTFAQGALDTPKMHSLWPIFSNIGNRGWEASPNTFLKSRFTMRKCPFRCKTPPSQGTVRCPSAASPTWMNIFFPLFLTESITYLQTHCLVPFFFLNFIVKKKRQIYILLYLLYISIHKHTHILLSDHLKVRHHDTSF